MMKAANKAFPASSVAVDPDTRISYTSQYDIFTVGAGYLNTEAALSDTGEPVGLAISPAVSFDAATGSTALISSIPGLSAIWGTNTTQAFNAIWGTTAIWGTGESSSEAIAIDGEK